MIIDGKLVSNELKKKLKEQINKYAINPKLVVIQVGNNEASNVYIKQKIKCADTIGAICIHEKLDENISTNELIALINKFISGFPTKLLRPTITTFFPSISIL